MSAHKGRPHTLAQGAVACLECGKPVPVRNERGKPPTSMLRRVPFTGDPEVLWTHVGRLGGRPSVIAEPPKREAPKRGSPSHEPTRLAELIAPELPDERDDVVAQVIAGEPFAEAVIGHAFSDLDVDDRLEAEAVDFQKRRAGDYDDGQ